MGCSVARLRASGVFLWKLEEPINSVLEFRVFVSLNPILVLVLLGCSYVREHRESASDVGLV